MKPGWVVFTDNDNHWTAAEYDNINKDNGALDAHWGAMMTYDYFFMCMVGTVMIVLGLLFRVSCM